MKEFSFELGADVLILHVGISGVVVARSQYVDEPDRYCIRYGAEGGGFVDKWMEEKDIAEAE